MSTPRRRAEAQPWHAESIAAWERFGANVVEERRELKKVQAHNMKRYLPVKNGR